jgi:hypothetical protein
VAAAAAGPAGILAHRGGAGRGYLTGAVTGAVHNTEQMEACTAALGLLEVLAQVAGPLLPDTSRAALDAVAYHIAACAAAAAERVAHEPLHVSAAAAAGVVALQAASLRALAATLLAPTSTRPPFFSQVCVAPNRSSHIVTSRQGGRQSALWCTQLTSEEHDMLHPNPPPLFLLFAPSTFPSVATPDLHAGCPAVLPGAHLPEPRGGCCVPGSYCTAGGPGAPTKPAHHWGGQGVCRWAQQCCTQVMD